MSEHANILEHNSYARTFYVRGSLSPVFKRNASKSFSFILAALHNFSVSSVITRYFTVFFTKLPSFLCTIHDDEDFVNHNKRKQIREMPE